MAGPRIVMTLKVRDEDDVLEDTLRYHLAQGVDFFIATDNGSTDSTPEILARYERAGLVRAIREEGTDFRRRGHEWVSAMARLAATEHEADWVIHNDADEFWWPLRGTLRDALASVPDRYGVVLGPRAEFFGRPEDGAPWWQRATVREARSLVRPKVAHRAYPDLTVLHRGAHDVAPGTTAEETWQKLRPPGRPVLRAVREQGAEPDDDRLVWSPEFPLRIFHCPLRSLAQYRRRVEVALFHGNFRESDTRRRLRRAYDEDRLEELYAELILSDEQVEAGLAAGTLERDERLRDALAACPADPIAEPPDPAALPRPVPEPAALEDEREQLRFDALHVISRTERMNMIRLDQQRERIDTLRAKLKRAKGSGGEGATGVRRALSAARRLKR